LKGTLSIFSVLVISVVLKSLVVKRMGFSGFPN
jgi:hypothetical protein